MRSLMKVILLVSCFGSWPVAAQQSNLSPDDMAIILGTFVTQTRLCPVKPANDYPIGLKVSQLGHNLADYLPGGQYDKLMEVRIDKAVEFVKLHGLKYACEGYTEYLLKYLPDLYGAGSASKPRG